MTVEVMAVGDAEALVVFSHGRLIPEVTLKELAHGALDRSPETAGREWNQAKIWVSMGFTSTLRVVHVSQTNLKAGQ